MPWQWLENFTLTGKEQKCDDTQGAAAGDAHGSESTDHGSCVTTINGYIS